MLLCRNHRGEWELPGGRPDAGERSADCVVREVREETGLHVTVNRLLGTRPLEVLPGAWVNVIAYACSLPATDGGRDLQPSEEHSRVAFVDPTAVPNRELAQPYRELIALH